MIKFDIDKLRVETYYVKSLTTALGGAIRVVDEEVSTEGHEVYHRIPVPLAVVRRFKTTYKTLKFLRPCLVAVTYYENRAIALERHPLGCRGERETQGLREMKRWIPKSERNIDDIIRPLIRPIKEQPEIYNWYFDGRYIFTFERPNKKKGEGRWLSADSAVMKAEFLSTDGRFRCVDVQAVGLHKIDEQENLEMADRSCLAYVANNGAYAISPPIWKNARQVGEAKIKGSHKERDGTATRELNFDKVDKFCAVNISFALKAAAKLSKEFGFEAVEPLNLPQLMIRLNTVNLPKVPPEVKDTFDSGMKFTHALAWLLGFARRCETLDTYATIRSLIKYLTSNGLYFKQAFNPKNIFEKGMNIESIPAISKKEALDGANLLSLDERLKIIRKQRDKTQRGGNVISGTTMFDDE